ncbi:hypothetical protein EV121DRAFT_273671 [Schizophyllum commune]
MRRDPQSLTADLFQVVLASIRLVSNMLPQFGIPAQTEARMKCFFDQGRTSLAMLEVESSSAELTRRTPNNARLPRVSHQNGDQPLQSLRRVRRIDQGSPLYCSRQFAGSLECSPAWDIGFTDSTPGTQGSFSIKRLPRRSPPMNGGDGEGYWARQCAGAASLIGRRRKNFGVAGSLRDGWVEVRWVEVEGELTDLPQQVSVESRWSPQSVACRLNRRHHPFAARHVAWKSTGTGVRSPFAPRRHVRSVNVAAGEP